MLKLTPELCFYVAEYINEELTRGATIDKYTIHDALNAFLGGASIHNDNNKEVINAKQ